MAKKNNYLYFTRDTFIESLLPYLDWRCIAPLSRVCKLWNKIINKHREFYLKEFTDGKANCILPNGVLDGTRSSTADNSKLTLSWDRGYLRTFRINIYHLLNISEIIEELTIRTYVSSKKINLYDGFICYRYNIYTKIALENKCKLLRIELLLPGFGIIIEICHRKPNIITSRIIIGLTADQENKHKNILDMKLKHYYLSSSTGIWRCKSVLELNKNITDKARYSEKKGWKSGVLTEDDYKLFQPHLPKYFPTR